MLAPTDFWSKIGHAESTIRSAINHATGYPADLTPEELEKLEVLLDELVTLLKVEA